MPYPIPDKAEVEYLKAAAELRLLIAQGIELPAEKLRARELLAEMETFLSRHARKPT